MNFFYRILSIKYLSYKFLSVLGCVIVLFYIIEYISSLHLWIAEKNFFYLLLYYPFRFILGVTILLYHYKYRIMIAYLCYRFISYLCEKVFPGSYFWEKRCSTFIRRFCLLFFIGLCLRGVLFSSDFLQLLLAVLSSIFPSFLYLFAMEGGFFLITFPPFPTQVESSIDTPSFMKSSTSDLSLKDSGSLATEKSLYPSNPQQEKEQLPELLTPVEFPSNKESTNSLEKEASLKEDKGKCRQVTLPKESRQVVYSQENISSLSTLKDRSKDFLNAVYAGDNKSSNAGNTSLVVQNLSNSSFNTTGQPSSSIQCYDSEQALMLAKGIQNQTLLLDKAARLMNLHVKVETDLGQIAKSYQHMEETIEQKDDQHKEALHNTKKILLKHLLGYETHITERIDDLEAQLKDFKTGTNTNFARVYLKLDDFTQLLQEEGSFKNLNVEKFMRLRAENLQKAQDGINGDLKQVYEDLKKNAYFDGNLAKAILREHAAKLDNPGIVEKMIEENDKKLAKREEYKQLSIQLQNQFIEDVSLPEPDQPKTLQLMRNLSLKLENIYQNKDYPVGAASRSSNLVPEELAQEKPQQVEQGRENSNRGLSLGGSLGELFRNERDDTNVTNARPSVNPTENSEGNPRRSGTERFSRIGDSAREKTQNLRLNPVNVLIRSTEVGRQMEKANKRADNDQFGEQSWAAQ